MKLKVKWLTKDLVFLSVFWLFIQLGILYFNSITINGEASRLIREANNLEQFGNFSSPAFYTYFTQIFLIYLLHIKMGFSYWAIVILQLLINYIATTYFYHFLLRFYNSRFLSIISTVIFISCIPFQLYNTYLYTESFFFSMGLIYSCMLLSTKEKSNAVYALSLSCLLLLLCVTRPTGMYFVVATAIYLFYKYSKKVSLFKLIAIVFGLFLIVICLLNIILINSNSFDVLLPFRYEHIICEVPTRNNEALIKTINDNNPLFELAYYIVNNFTHFSKLVLLKTKAFFGLHREYYSTIHNTYLSLFFYPLYIGFLYSLLKFKRKIPAAFIYIISLILIYWISVICSCDEWHNRFFLTLTPYLILGAVYCFKKKE